MPELHLKCPGWTYSACGPFPKHRERIKSLEKQAIYRSELDKSCFAHDAAYCDSKDFANRTILDKILKDGAHEIARNYG